MSNDTLSIVVLIGYAVLAVMMLFRSNRARVYRWFWAVYIDPPRRAYVSALRRVTGRQRPDYRRITEIERELDNE